MATPRTFPDAEWVVADYLTARLTVPVVTMVPDPRPSTFVRVTRTGGPARDIVHDRPVLTVESWATVPSEAASQAQTVRRLLGAIGGQVVAGAAVGRWIEVSAPQNLPDPNSAQHRYTFAGELPMRSTPTGS